MAFRKVVDGLRSLFHKTEVDREMDDEVRGFVEESAREKMKRGVSREESLRAARLELGGVERVKEEVRAFGWEAIAGNLWQDLRLGLRMMRKSPGFTAVMVLTLALGIGANGAVFSILRAVLLQPLPYKDPSRVVMIWHSPLHPPVDSHFYTEKLSRGIPTGGMANAIHEGSQGILSDVAVYVSWQANNDAQFDLLLGDRARRLNSAYATPNFFDVLGVSAAEGRVFTAADESSHEPLLVLSDALWHGAFGGDPSIIGRSFALIVGLPRHSETFTVIGVLPPSFRFTYPQETEAWAMYPWDRITPKRRFEIGFWMVARLAPGVTLSSAQARIRDIPTNDSLARLAPEDRQVVTLEPITSWVVGETRPSMYLLASIALLLLLITCANIAGGLFVRMSGRQLELAVRTAIGAARSRIIQQLLTEGILLCGAGALLGTGCAAAAVPIIRALVPSTVPRADEISVSAWMVGFFGAVACLTIALLAPVLRGARVDVMTALHRASAVASADHSTSRWRFGLVGTQATIASALLLTAILLITSFWRLSHVPLGFAGERVLTVEMRLLSPKYMSTAKPEQPDKQIPSPALVALQEQLLNAVHGLPGVLDTGLTSAVPFRGVDFVAVLGRPGHHGKVFGNLRYVDPGYFSVLNVPIIRGRVFDDTDTAVSQRVAVISESYARQMFGGENPIGQFIDTEEPKQVIGVVGDMRYIAFDKDPNPALYVPEAQTPVELVCVIARVAPNAGDITPTIREIVRKLDPELPITNVTMLDSVVNDSIADRRFYTTATAAFASLAFILSIFGLLVVVSRLVVERRRELAIRAALGAAPASLSRLVVAQVLSSVTIGMAIGLALVFAGATVLRHFLFHVEPRAPLAYGGVGAIVLIVAVAAALVPARRAMRVDPMVVLRHE